MIGKVLEKLEAKAEKKSWDPEEIVYFDIGIRKRVKTEYGYHEEWFWGSYRKQTNDYPRGITEKIALKLGTRVFRRMVWRKRIK